MNKHKQFIKDAYNGEFGSMCSEWKETILKNYPEFEEVEDVEFKVGDWVVVLDTGFQINSNLNIGGLERVNYIGKNKPNGEEGIYSKHIGFDSGSFGNADRCLGTKLIKATKEEIEKHLIEEAKRRGFKEGIRISRNIGMIANTYLNTRISKTRFSSYNGFQYTKEYDYLTLEGFVIYKEGNWAEIIKTITKEEAEKKLNCKII